ncbi:hypothetical protein FGADI_11755 [Fusarium gaditjirri]|uniref:Uncharacterized protein n=1 Tax=Fusarium gaditjirri TaxID=282569 RepID=A0A8H4WP73_9HYPO|nr:hypothetical protein FGADI_11755 [Fusarium gaditjirri]
MSLKGKVVLITGGSKGIGKAVVERVVADGASVVINYSSDSKLAEDLAFNLNVKGPCFLVQKVVKHMPRDGRVILVSSGVLHQSQVAPRYLLYASSKGSVEQMTRILAKDLGQRGITVNAIAPGPTATEMFFQGKSQELIDTIACFSPLGRLGKPEEIAGLAAFLAGPTSSWLSGQGKLVLSCSPCADIGLECRSPVFYWFNARTGPSPGRYPPGGIDGGCPGGGPGGSPGGSPGGAGGGGAGIGAGCGRHVTSSLNA